MSEKKQDPAWAEPLRERLASGPKTMLALLVTTDQPRRGETMRARAWVFEASASSAFRLNDALDGIESEIGATVGFVDADPHNLETSACAMGEAMGMALCGVCLVTGAQGCDSERQAIERFERWAQEEGEMIASVSMSYVNKNNRVVTENLMGALFAAWEAAQLAREPASAPRRGPSLKI